MHSRSEPGGLLCRMLPQLVRLTAATGAEGLVSDYEPHQNTTAAHTRAYASFLARLASSGRVLLAFAGAWSVSARAEIVIMAPAAHTAMTETLVATVDDANRAEFGSTRLRSARLVPCELSQAVGHAEDPRHLANRGRLAVLGSNQANMALSPPDNLISDHG